MTVNVTGFYVIGNRIQLSMIDLQSWQIECLFSLIRLSVLIRNAYNKYRSWSYYEWGAEIWRPACKDTFIRAPFSISWRRMRGSAGKQIWKLKSLEKVKILLWERRKIPSSVMFANFSVLQAFSLSIYISVIRTSNRVLLSKFVHLTYLRFRPLKMF